MNARPVNAGYVTPYLQRPLRTEAELRRAIEERLRRRIVALDDRNEVLAPEEAAELRRSAADAGIGADEVEAFIAAKGVRS